MGPVDMAYHMARLSKTLGLAAIALALALPGCGKKGPLERPAVEVPPGPNDAPVGEQKPVSDKPDRPFILDGIIR